MAEVSEIVGRPMADKGSLTAGTCTFSSDQDLTTSVTVSAAAQVTKQSDYDKLRASMIEGSPAGAVVDVDKGERGFIVIRPVGSEAVVINDTGTFAMNLTAVYMNDEQKKAALLKLIDAALS